MIKTLAGEVQGEQGILVPGTCTVLVLVPTTTLAMSPVYKYWR